MSDYFETAANLRAVEVRDNPARTAAPDYEDAGPDFDELPLRRQLDIAERAYRSSRYQGALDEAFSVDNKVAFQKFLAVLLDSSCSDRDVGTTARELALQYLSRCAAVRHEDLAELGG